MGRAARPKPKRLAGKLKPVREALGLSQTEMLRELGLDKDVYYTAISGYELGTREPPLPVLLKYAGIAGVYVDVLIDDDLDLPRKIPARKRKL